MSKTNKTPIWKQIQNLLLGTMAGTGAVLLVQSPHPTIWEWIIFISGLLLMGTGWIGLANLSENMRIQEQEQVKKKDKMKKRTYYYAYDPLIKRRVAHIRKNNQYISLVTGHTSNLKRNK